MPPPILPPVPLVIVFDIEFSDIIAPNVQAAADAFRAASFRAAEYVRLCWARAAGELGAHDTGEYVRGIADHGQIRPVAGADGSATLAEVVFDIVNTAPHASIVEDGHGAFHLPSKINWSGPKVKRSAKGTPYLSIPFEHAAYASPEKRIAQGLTRQTLARMMPEEVYHEAKNLTRTLRQGVGPIRKPNGQHMALDRYHWGGRVRRGTVSTAHRGDARGRGELFQERRGERQVGRLPGRRGAAMVNPAWKGSKFEGMFKAGPARHTSYMTIRTLTPDSPGWNIPAQVGYGVARQVASELQNDEMLHEILADAMLSVFPKDDE